MMSSWTRGIRLRAALGMVAVLAACGGYSAPSGPNYGTTSIQPASPSGNNQIAPAGGDLPMPVRIVALKDGVPIVGATINWTATGVGAFMTPAENQTGADGVATSVWHLGTDPGAQTARAVLAGDATVAPVAFTATALNPNGDPQGVSIQLRSAGGNRFEPADVNIPSGTTVTWTWVDGIHDVVHQSSPGGPGFGDSGAPVNAPNTYSFRFTTPGTYLYFCEVHGTLTTGMHGTITVR